MEAEKDNFSITMMARVLRVSRSGFYSWRRRGGASDPHAALKVRIKAVWESSGCRYGARTIHAELSGEATLYRVRKCMKALGIFGMTPRARRQTTIPDENAKHRPDLIGRRFKWPVATTASVGDITYLKTGEGWLYLATVIDLSTRMVTGWAFSKSCIPSRRNRHFRLSIFDTSSEHAKPQIPLCFSQHERRVHPTTRAVELNEPSMMDDTIDRR